MSYAKAAVRRLLPDPLYRMYRRRKIARQVMKYEPRLVTRSYSGCVLTVELRDPLGEGWYDRDWPPLPELERLRQHGLRDGALVFDLGAHQGIVALIMADIVGPGGRVVAVEAEPHNAAAAARNRELNTAENLEIIHAAGAAREGTVLFAEGLNGHVDDLGSRWGKVEVPALTVDALAERFGQPDVVMIDVEGFEGEVLDGAMRTIGGGATSFLVEVHVNHGLRGPPEPIVERFLSGFRVLVAPVERDQDVFEPYEPGSPVVADRFFLLATPT